MFWYLIIVLVMFLYFAASVAWVFYTLNRRLRDEISRMKRAHNRLIDELNEAFRYKPPGRPN